jgi:hypothetical protein
MISDLNVSKIKLVAEIGQEQRKETTFIKKLIASSSKIKL